MNPPPRSGIRIFVDAVGEAIALAQEFGRDGDWYSLRRRVSALEGRVDEDEADAARLDTGSVADAEMAYRVEQGIAMGVLTDLLTPATLNRVAMALRGAGGADADLGPWAPLDDSSFAEIETRRSRQEAAAAASVIAALLRHARKPRRATVLEAIRALEDLQSLRGSRRRPSSRGREILQKEARRLGEALGEVLPPLARWVVSAEIEDRFRSRIEVRGVDEPDRTRAFWHHRIPGVGPWYPVWSRLLAGGDGPDLPGTWFNRAYQEAYEELDAGVRAGRARRLREEEEGNPQASQQLEELHQDGGAEPERPVRRVWVQETPDVDHERRRRSAEAEGAELLQRKGEAAERRRLAEALESQRLAERAEMKQRSKEQRRASASTRGRTWDPREARRRWREAEWIRWCKSKGMSPEEFTAEDHARFDRWF